jgi:hypothetical protein
MRWAISVVAFGALTFAAVPSKADVTITMSLSTKTAAMTTEMSSVTYLKGMKSRVDVKGMAQDMSILVDAAAKLQLMVNHVTKQVQSLDPKADKANTPTNAGVPSVSFEPLNQTKDVLGHTCTGYMMRVSLPMKVGEETFTITTSGPVWMTKDGRDVAEWMAFDKAVAAAGFTMSSFAQGLESQATAEAQKVMAEKGVPLEREMQIKIDGSGPMAQKLAQRSNFAMTLKVTAISTDPIPTTFPIPVHTKK